MLGGPSLQFPAGVRAVGHSILHPTQVSCALIGGDKRTGWLLELVLSPVPGGICVHSPFLSVPQMQDEYSTAERGRQLHMDLSEDYERDAEGPPEEAVAARPKGSIKEEEDAKGAQEEEMVEEEEEEDEEEKEMWEVREEEEEDEHRLKRSYSLTESFEEELMGHLEEYERMLMDFQAELELTRTKYSLATGRKGQGLMPLDVVAQLCLLCPVGMRQEMWVPLHQEVGPGAQTHRLALPVCLS